MKYSPIAPIALLQDLHYNHGLLGDYHLVLAHDVLAHKNDYHSLFSDLRKQYPGLFVILDNSTIELGQPLDMEALLRAAAIVRADCIVMPDVLGNPIATVDAGWAFWSQYSTDHQAHTPLMAVPQGNTFDEYTVCARLLMGIPDVQYWGIPRAMSTQYGTRKHPGLQELLGYGHTFETMQKNVPAIQPRVHMLGMSANYFDDIACAKLPGVMGIDSCNPITLGQNNISMLDSTRHIPRGDVWVHTKATMTTLDNIAYVRAGFYA